MEFHAFQQTLTQPTSKSSSKLQPAFKSCIFWTRSPREKLLTVS